MNPTSKILIALLLFCLQASAASIGIQWKCPAANVTKFTIYKTVNGITTKITDVGPDVRQTYVNNLPTNTYVILTVRAWNGGLESPASNRLQFNLRLY